MMTGICSLLIVLVLGSFTSAAVLSGRLQSRRGFMFIVFSDNGHDLAAKAW